MRLDRYRRNTRQDGYQAFNDGLVFVFATKNEAKPGAMPVVTKTVKGKLRFKERVVGVDGYYRGLEGVGEITRLLRCPLLKGVSVHDLVKVVGEEEEYEIAQIQYIVDAAPPSMDIALKCADRGQGDV